MLVQIVHSYTASAAAAVAGDCALHSITPPAHQDYATIYTPEMPGTTTRSRISFRAVGAKSNKLLNVSRQLKVGRAYSPCQENTRQERLATTACPTCLY